MFHRSGFENTRPDGFPVLEVAPGDGAPADGPPQFVPLRRSAITGEILGPVADLTLTQTFSYSSAECSRVLEALYRFPLPGVSCQRSGEGRVGTSVASGPLRRRRAQS